MKLVSADINLFSSDRNLIRFCWHSAFLSQQTAISYLYSVKGFFFVCFETEMDAFTARYELYM